MFSKTLPVRAACFCLHFQEPLTENNVFTASPLFQKMGWFGKIA
jgi:hypothetical protein